MSTVFNDFLLVMDDAGMQKHIMAFVFGCARIAALVRFAAFAGPSVSMGIRMSLAVALYLPLHPLIYEQMPPVNYGELGSLLKMTLFFIKEGIIGFAMAMLISMLFYIAMAAGVIIDNQRGASAAQVPDPFTEEQSSPLGNIFILAAVNLFLASGAFMAFVGILYSSYLYWPVFDFVPAILNNRNAVFIASEVDFLAEKSLMLAAPFVLTALLCDIALGIMNRFAPQLNVYVLSMPIKSAIAAFLVILYMSPFYDFMHSLYPHMKQIFLNLTRMG